MGVIRDAYVVGVDGFKGGWVWVALGSGRPVEVGYAATVPDLLDTHGEAAVIAIDIPIGLPLGPPDGACRRLADVQAKTFLAPGGSAVFTIPPAVVLSQPSHAEATACATELCGLGISQQAYALRLKIFEAADAAAVDDRLVEVHPEASFRALAGEPLPWGKKSWNGHRLRRSLLADAGIVVPDHLDGNAGRAGPDDVLDAAVVGWSALRLLAGTAVSLPDPPESIAGRQVAIWY
jgi:predicted RNase H-like nuclease